MRRDRVGGRQLASDIGVAEAHLIGKIAGTGGEVKAGSTLLGDIAAI